MNIDVKNEKNGKNCQRNVKIRDDKISQEIPLHLEIMQYLFSKPRGVSVALET